MKYRITLLVTFLILLSESIAGNQGGQEKGKVHIVSLKDGRIGTDTHVLDFGFQSIEEPSILGQEVPKRLESHAIRNTFETDLYPIDASDVLDSFQVDLCQIDPSDLLNSSTILNEQDTTNSFTTTTCLTEQQSPEQLMVRSYLTQESEDMEIELWAQKSQMEVDHHIVNPGNAEWFIEYNDIGPNDVIFIRNWLEPELPVGNKFLLSAYNRHQISEMRSFAKMVENNTEARLIISIADFKLDLGNSSVETDIAARINGEFLQFGTGVIVIEPQNESVGGNRAIQNLMLASTCFDVMSSEGQNLEAMKNEFMSFDSDDNYKVTISLRDIKIAFGTLAVISVLIFPVFWSVKTMNFRLNKENTELKESVRIMKVKEQEFMDTIREFSRNVGGNSVVIGDNAKDVIIDQSTNIKVDYQAVAQELLDDSIVKSKDLENSSEIIDSIEEIRTLLSNKDKKISFQKILAIIAGLGGLAEITGLNVLEFMVNSKLLGG